MGARKRRSEVIESSRRRRAPVSADAESRERTNENWIPKVPLISSFRLG